MSLDYSIANVNVQCERFFMRNEKLTKFCFHLSDFPSKMSPLVVPTVHHSPNSGTYVPTILSMLSDRSLDVRKRIKNFNFQQF